jgi:hypothetical protein
MTRRHTSTQFAWRKKFPGHEKFRFITLAVHGLSTLFKLQLKKSMLKWLIIHSLTAFGRLGCGAVRLEYSNDAEARPTKSSD